MTFDVDLVVCSHCQEPSHSPMVTVRTSPRLRCPDGCLFEFSLVRSSETWTVARLHSLNEGKGWAGLRPRKSTRLQKQETLGPLRLVSPTRARSDRETTHAGTSQAYLHSPGETERHGQTTQAGWRLHHLAGPMAAGVVAGSKGVEWMESSEHGWRRSVSAGLRSLAALPTAMLGPLCLRN